jgi:restriction system protein
LRDACIAKGYEAVGYTVRATAYSGDEGIDLFVLDGQSDTIGVQVKRYKNKIEAEQIRALVGALMLQGITTGIFVTTSDFRKGAETTAHTSKQKGTPIQLWNAVDFYERLNLSQRMPYEFLDDPSAPYHRLVKNPHLMPMVHSSFQASKE